MATSHKVDIDPERPGPSTVASYSAVTNGVPVDFRDFQKEFSPQGSAVGDVEGMGLSKLYDIFNTTFLLEE